MKLETSFLLIFSSFLISFNAISAQICLNGYFRPNSTYGLNRRQILSSLASNVTSHNGFFNSSIGQIPNRIFIIGMCIPEMKPETCSNCIKDASDRLLESCPNQTEAYSWPGDCIVRYSNISFSGSLVMEPSLQLYTQGDFADIKFTVFDRVYEELMARTIAAASNRSLSLEQKYFAAEVASLTTFETMYAMMQCTPDVSSRDCEFCLNKSVGENKSCCRGKQGGWVSRPSCMFQWELYSFSEAFDTLPPPGTHPPPPSLTPPDSDRANTTGKDGKTISTGTIVAIVVPTIVILAVLAVSITVCRKKKPEKIIKVQAGDDITRARSVKFSFKTLEAATDTFSDSNLIGQGGFGEVYKGRLPTGTEVAVKRLSKSSGQGARELKNEAVLLTKLQHRNLVRLLGFCLEGEEKILVYEFVPNKSLDSFLFEGKLDWTRRYNIIRGIARGLLYLHQDSQLKIIHRDLKVSNILLDADLNPKIADFGMARIFGVDQSQANTKRIVGTYGYMSPEYAMRGHFSMKSDVYSFGVMILEIISGKRNSSFYHIDDDDSAGNLVTHAWRLWRNGSRLELVDPTLEESYDSNEAIRCIHIALLCVQENPAVRPMLPAIILMLTSRKTTLPVPRAPGFCFSSMHDFDFQSTSRSIPSSINDVTITDLDPR